MDIVAATVKIADIVLTINEYKAKIEETYNGYATKINNYIDEFERIVNKWVASGNKAIQWLEMQIKKVFKKITDIIDAATAKINPIFKQIVAWYEKVVKKVKLSVIKNYFAKMGQSISDEAVEPLTSIIPHPSIESLLPTVSFEIQIPDVAANIDYIQEIELKKLPLI